MTLPKMLPLERRAAFSLASIMALRMLGLFMVLPLFSLYAHQLIGATPFLIGISLGIYGLTQAFLQIPFGMLSDHIGRRVVITFGLLLFIIGSIIAARSHSIFTMIIGRALQGCGAVGSTIMAMIADLTRPEQRSKAMAIVGMSIGMAFTSAMMIGPLLSTWFSIPGIFWLTAFLSLFAIIILFAFVPKPQHLSFHEEAETDFTQFSAVLMHPLLSKLYISIFLLHAIFTATFVVVPISLEKLAGLSSHQQWYLYLPLMILAFAFSIPLIILAEKKHQLKKCFLLAILILGAAEFLWWFDAKNLVIAAIALLLFLTAFTLLEAFLPSLISKSAPKKRKGTALGIFSASQFLGIFFGGLIGGWLYGKVSLNAVYLLCVILALLWVSITSKMKMGEHYGERR